MEQNGNRGEQERAWEDKGRGKDNLQELARRARQTEKELEELKRRILQLQKEVRRRLRDD